jgi:hypothetical protein
MNKRLSNTAGRATSALEALTNNLNPDGTRDALLHAELWNAGAPPLQALDQMGDFT